MAQERPGRGSDGRRSTSTGGVLHVRQGLHWLVGRLQFLPPKTQAFAPNGAMALAVRRCSPRAPEAPGRRASRVAASVAGPAARLRDDRRDAGGSEQLLADIRPLVPGWSGAGGAPARPQTHLRLDAADAR